MTLIVVAVTLVPLPAPEPEVAGEHGRAVEVFCLICGQFGTADFLLNAALFVPLGIFVHLAIGQQRGLAAAILTGLALSTLVEVSQLFLPGRFSTLGDLAANTLGAGLGGLAVRWRQPLIRPRVDQTGNMALAAGLCACSIFLATGWLLTPSATEVRTWVQWTPGLANYEPFTGRVLWNRIGDLSLSPGRLDQSGTNVVRRAIERGWPITASIQLGRPPSGLAPILSFYDDRHRENLLLGQDQMDVVLRVRYRADGLRFHRPQLRSREALLGRSFGDTVRVVVWRPPAGSNLYRGRIDSSANDNGSANLPPRRATGSDDPSPPADAYCLATDGNRRCGLGFRSGRGWALLLDPRWFSPTLLRAIDGFWTGLLILPLGFWSCRQWGFGLGLLLTGGGLLAAPALTPLLWPGAAEAAGAVVGLATGRGLGRVARRPR